MSSNPVEVDGHDHAEWDTIVRLTQPADPAGNVFIVAFDAGKRHIGTIRFGIPDPPDTMVTVRIGMQTLRVLRGGGWEKTTRVVVVAYGPAYLTDPVIAITATAAQQSALEMYDMVMVRDGRAWSYLCPDEEHHVGGPGLPIDPLSDTAIHVATVLGQAQEP